MTARTLVLVGAFVHFAAFLAARVWELTGVQRVLLEPLGSTLRLIVPPASQAAWYASSVLVLAAASLLWGAAAAACWFGVRHSWRSGLASRETGR